MSEAGGQAQTCVGDHRWRLTDQGVRSTAGGRGVLESGPVTRGVLAEEQAQGRWGEAWQVYTRGEFRRGLNDIVGPFC